MSTASSRIIGSFLVASRRLPGAFLAAPHGSWTCICHRKLPGETARIPTTYIAFPPACSLRRKVEERWKRHIGEGSAHTESDVRHGGCGKGASWVGAALRAQERAEAARPLQTREQQQRRRHGRGKEPPRGRGSEDKRGHAQGQAAQGAPRRPQCGCRRGRVGVGKREGEGVGGEALGRGAGGEGRGAGRRSRRTGEEGD